MKANLVALSLAAAAVAWIARGYVPPEQPERPRRIMLEPVRVYVAGDKAAWQLRWLEDRLDYGLAVQMVQVADDSPVPPKSPLREFIGGSAYEY